jgi:hypothetical protein
MYAEKLHCGTASLEIDKMICHKIEKHLLYKSIKQKKDLKIAFF